MRIFLAVMICVTAVVAYISAMGAVHAAALWAYANFGIIPFFIIFPAVFALSVWIEKRRQRRLGIKRPLFRFTND